MEENEDCMTCKFFGQGFEENEGYCFRFPPFPSLVKKSGGYIYLYPEVGESTWCGEYRPETTNK